MADGNYSIIGGSLSHRTLQTPGASVMINQIPIIFVRSGRFACIHKRSSLSNPN